MNNNFDVEVMPDGKIKVTSTGGFNKETHNDADEFLALVKSLAGGETVTRKLPPKPQERHTHQHHTH